MKTNFLFLATTLLSLTIAPVLAAEGKDELTAAAKKLSDNYSWTSTVESGMGQSTSQGKTIKDGTVWLLVKFGENTTESYIKSAGKAAIKLRDQDWKTLEELTNDEQGPGRWIARMIQNYKAPGSEVGNIASKTKELKKEGDVYSGELTEEGAKDLLPFGGRRGGNAPEPKDAKGSVKFWLKDGALSKYELKLQGKMNFNGEDRDVSRTVTIEIKDAGSTKLEIPEAVQKKLS